MITLAELQQGCDLKQPGRRRTEYANHLAQWERWLRGRIFDVDAVIAKRAGSIKALRRLKGKELIDMAHPLIAATAIQHEMIVATNNVDDFEDTGVEIFNPFR